MVTEAFLLVVVNRRAYRVSLRKASPYPELRLNIAVLSSKTCNLRPFLFSFVYMVKSERTETVYLNTDLIPEQHREHLRQAERERLVRIAETSEIPRSLRLRERIRAMLHGRPQRNVPVVELTPCCEQATC